MTKRWIDSEEFLQKLIDAIGEGVVTPSQRMRMAEVIREAEEHINALMEPLASAGAVSGGDSFEEIKSSAKKVRAKEAKAKEAA